MGSVNHVLDACGFLPNPNAEVYVDASKGYRGILDAATKLSTTGGTIVVGPGTFTFPAGTALQPVQGVSLRGAGQMATVLQWATGHTGNCIAQPQHSVWSDFKFIAPTTITSDYAFKVGPNAIGTYLTATDRIYGMGGSTDPGYTYALMAFLNSMYSAAHGVFLESVNSNGIHWLMDPATATWNAGNSVWENIFVYFNNGVTGKWGMRVEGEHNNLYNGTPASTSSDGLASLDNYNLMQFNYIGVIINAAAGGNTGLWLVNAPRNAFNMVDMENVETGIKIDSAIGGGSTSHSNTFTNIYCGGNATASVVIDSGTSNTLFLGGEITGTFSDSGTKTQCVNVKAPAGVGGVLPEYKPETIAGTPAVNNAFGQFSTCYKNWTGSTVPKGTVMRFGTADGSVVQTDATALIGTNWVGICVADAPYPGIVRCAVKGTSQVLVSNTVARNDILVVDPANAGKAKSNGNAMPTNHWEFIGFAAAGATAGQLCYVAVK